MLGNRVIINNIYLYILRGAIIINTDIENIQSKESKVNINMRVRESLKNKIKDTLENDSKTPDELFSQMFTAYLKEQAVSKGEADYSSDITELNGVINRISTIFQNMIEKTYMQNSILRENFASELNLTKSEMETRYEEDISKLKKERDILKKEYDLITEQAKALLTDTKKLKETASSLKETNNKNEELIKTYKEQIDNLKNTNEELKEKIKNSIDSSLLEREEIKKEKELLEKDRYYQNTINTMQDKYNELQLKYTKLLESTISKKE